MKNFYITTPIYYVNDIPHIGHAYTTIAADVLSRFKRLSGFNVHFMTGTDEHGQKIAKAAEKAGITPQEFVDKAVVPFKDMMRILNIEYDDFIRTTEKRHIEYVSTIWDRLLNKGLIYLAKYSGWYSIRDEAFYNEDEIVDNKAPTGAPVEWVEEESYFFKLSSFQEKLLSFYQDNPDFIAPQGRRNEVISFVKSGLHDLSVSRTTFNWGIPVPNANNHVMYVWLDALFSYISNIIDNKQYFWPCDIHLVGKDILRFHAIYWPAFLMAAEIELPKKILAHGWWTNAGVKISKSIGNVIDPKELVQKFGLDYVRYFLMRAITFGNDGNYSESQFIEMINAELANNIGNLVQRIVSFAHKNCSGMVPSNTKLNDQDKALLAECATLYPKLQLLIDTQKIDHAIGIIIDFATTVNKYIDSEAPWKLIKTDEDRMYSIVYSSLEAIRVIALLLKPFIPGSAINILTIFNRAEDSFKMVGVMLEPGLKLGAAIPIFPRII